MRCHHDAAQYVLGSHRHLWTVVETAHDLAFRALLELVWRKVQTCLDKRMVEHAVLFAAGYKSKPGQ